MNAEQASDRLFGYIVISRRTALVRRKTGINATGRMFR
jgi:hypothetical protein